MSRALPPLDAHAHINPNAAARELESLGAVVFAASRTMDEYERTLGRTDQVTVWGVGCHPGVREAVERFDLARFERLLRTTPLVSEVGLDDAGRGRPIAEQEVVFRSILDAVTRMPRVVSVHSHKATERVLDVIAESARQGLILHWWLGKQTTTARALELGCHFSVNRRMDPKSLRNAGVPIDALLPETDHPDGNRRPGGLRQPGWTVDVEQKVAVAYDLTPAQVRAEFWRSLARITADVGVRDMFPRPVQVMLTAAEGQQAESMGGE